MQFLKDSAPSSQLLRPLITLMKTLQDILKCKIEIISDGPAENLTFIIYHNQM